MISKPHIIDAIQQLNRSAHRDWLDQFPQAALRRYLDHLELALERRGRASIWVRPADNPAIVTRRPTP